MKKKILIPIIVAAFLIVLVVGVFLLKSSLDNISKSAFGFTVNEKNPATCEKITETSGRDTCYNVVAVNIEDYSLCKKIGNNRQKDICFSGVANKIRDMSLCEKISDPGVKDLCYDNFNHKKGLSYFTIEFYKDYSSAGGSKYFKANLTFKDNALISGWQEYEISGREGQIIDEYFLDVKSLSWIDNKTGGKWNFESEVPLNKEGVLQKIDSGEFKSIDNCSHDDMCYEIVNSQGNVLGIDDWDWDSGQNCNGFTIPEQCEELEWPIDYGCRKAEVYNCYACLAEKNTEPSICEKIVLDEKEAEDFLHDNCYWRLAVKFSNENKVERIDFCEKFVEPGHKKACYDMIAG